MPNAADIQWFKQQFQPAIEAAVLGTALNVDMLVAVACQETGPTWSMLRKKGLPLQRILDLCVGDTLDEDRGRKAFPRNRAELLAAPGGSAMFEIARQALLDMAAHDPGYQRAATNPGKFCRGFGIFQLDLQFFRSDPDYFVKRHFADFGQALRRCVLELLAAKQRIGWKAKPSLTDFEAACVAVAYNTGGFKPEKGLRQGYFNGSRYYGEQFFDFLRQSMSVPHFEAAAGNAALPPPTPISAQGAWYEVEVRDTLLRLRSAPQIDPANVLANLPDGQLVRAVRPRKTNGFVEVQTQLRGAFYSGYCAGNYLRLANGPASAAIARGASGANIAAALPPVHMPRLRAKRTSRATEASAHSLNEPRQPSRTGRTPDALRTELQAIIDWLGTDDPSHLRYRSNHRRNPCAVHAHDYCHLAGVYLPRVWWTAGAVRDLALGRAIAPLLGATIEVLDVDGQSGWLRDFGRHFGWRQTGSSSRLQLEVNQGAIGLIVARRDPDRDAPAGRITVVVPESGTHAARRNAQGEVSAPLQSQTGARRPRRGNGRANWWRDEGFADSGFWLHA